MNRSHMMHTIALWLWGFVGCCVLCNICFASFIAQLMTFDISSSWEIRRWRFFSLMHCCCFFVLRLHQDLPSVIVLMRVEASLVLSASRLLFLFSLSVFFPVEAASIFPAPQHLFKIILLLCLRFSDSSKFLAWCFVFLLSLSLSCIASFFLVTS